MMKRDFISRSLFLLGVMIIGVTFASCGRPKATIVVIVNPKDGFITMAGELSRVEFGFIEGVFQPKLCEENIVFVFRADATACSQAGKAGHAYQVQKEMKFKDVGTIDLNKSDAEIALIFGIKETEPTHKIGFTYPH